ncbi:unnamed protein product, partial [Allacma fusca]
MRQLYRDIGAFERIWGVVRIYRNITVLMKLFNDAFANVTYALKLTYMNGLVLMLVVSVRWSSSSPTHALLLMVLVGQTFLGCSALFGYAYTSTARVSSLKAEILNVWMKSSGHD